MDPVQALGLGDVLARLGAAALIGGAVGINRELHGKPAGLRTLALLTLRAALLTLIGASLDVADGRPDERSFSRVVQGIVAGIGFLGGGVILRDEAKQSVHGLTTAAAIWVAASLGIACGAGYWRTALAALTLTLMVLMAGGPVERVVNRMFGTVRPAPPGRPTTME